MTLPPLLRLSYWFTLTPPPFLPWIQWALLGLFAVMLFGGMVLAFVATRQGTEKVVRRAMNRVASMLAILGGFGLLLFVLSFERIYVLGMRAGYLLWVALLAYYAWRTYHLVRIEIPADKQRRADREAMNKWLPTSKK